MRILAIGDVVSRPGRKILKETLSKIKDDYKIDLCIANGENAATGNGITYKITKELFSYGVDLITLGNHTWAKKEIYGFIGEQDRMIRPINFISKFPGKGSSIISKQGVKVGIINSIGRTFFDNLNEHLECPFSRTKQEVDRLREQADIILVDFHAEATSEKIAFGWFLDGYVSAVFGTHTHVQTADERILPKGTGFITDIGMTGPYNSVLGISTDVIIKRFITKEPAKFQIADGEKQLNGIFFDINNETGKCEQIERIRYFLK